MAFHCPECGFIGSEGANYCQKCGAYLADESGQSTTASFAVDDVLGVGALADAAVASTGSVATLAIRAGGRHVGDTYLLDRERMMIGRSPNCEVFLDDVTVSRNHAVIVRRGDEYYIDDLGSLNSTYVNRHRIDSHQLSNGDEVQVGKYRLAFLRH